MISFIVFLLVHFFGLKYEIVIRITVHVYDVVRLGNFFNPIIIIIIIFSGSAAQRGLCPPRPRGFLITHNDAPQSVGLLWTSDQLVGETST
jgi:hypothetical protein